jgi:hypothetical protein
MTVDPILMRVCGRDSPLENIKRRRAEWEEPLDPNYIKALKLLRRYFAQKVLRNFFFKVIRPCGSRNIARRFCESGPTLEEAKSIP